MINFIICDDEKHYVDNIIRVIDNVMMNNDVEYNKYTFNEYNKSFLNLVNTEPKIRNSKSIVSQLNPLVVTINIPIIVTKNEPSKSSAPLKYTKIPSITQVMRNINCIIK